MRRVNAIYMKAVVGDPRHSDKSPDQARPPCASRLRRPSTEVYRFHMERRRAGAAHDGARHRRSCPYYMPAGTQLSMLVVGARCKSLADTRPRRGRSSRTFLTATSNRGRCGRIAYLNFFEVRYDFELFGIRL